jgi:hypothetical protein
MASTTGTIFSLTIQSPTRTDASLIASPLFPLHLRPKPAQEPGMSALLGRTSYISRALYRKSWPVQNMGIDHGGGDIRMSQEFLHRAYIVMGLQQMRGKGVAQPRRFCNGSKIYLFDLGEADPPWPITSNSGRTRNLGSYWNLWILEINR